MHETILYLGLLWLTLLLGIGLLLVVRARTFMRRIMVLDALSLILIAFLTLFAYSQRQVAYLDAALVMALLTFLVTIAASHYHSEEHFYHD